MLATVEEKRSSRRRHVLTRELDLTDGVDERSYGSTLNFGRPAAWAFILVLVLGPLAFAWALGT